MGRLPRRKLLILSLGVGVLIVVGTIVFFLFFSDDRKSASLFSTHRNPTELLQQIDTLQVMIQQDTSAEVMRVLPELLSKYAGLTRFFIHQFPDHPRTPELYLRSISAYHTLGKLDSTLALIEEFLSRYPEHPMVPDMLFLKGMALSYQAPREAQQVFQELIQRYPDHPYLVEPARYYIQDLEKRLNRTSAKVSR